MTGEEELGGIAKAIIDSNRYLTLGTADEHGLPWVSPVWYAPAEYAILLGRVDGRHGR